MRCRRCFSAAVSHHRSRQLRTNTSIFTLTYPIIGGMGSISGGLIGGGVLRLFPELLRPLADYIELVFCVLVVGTLTFAPDGLASAIWTLGRRSRHKATAGAATGKGAPVVKVAELFSVGKNSQSASLRDQPFDTPVLAIESISRSYGALRAVDGVSLTIASGALHGLMGPNGAGKTTLFNLVSGFVPPEHGRVVLSGVPLDGVPIERRIGLGMTRTFQHAAVFQRLTCLDNVMIGLGRNTVLDGTKRSIAAALDTESFRAERQAAHATLEAVGLSARAQDAASALSLGDQRRLEIARAIVSRPRVILLDEPVSGVSAEEAQRLRELLLAVNRELGIAMVVIEHNIRFLVSLCERISVMSEGKVIAEGAGAAMVDDARVRRRLLRRTRGRGVMLEVTSLRVASGAMIRVDGLDLALPERGCIALLGPNGAGKTTSVEAIAGLIPKAAGQVMFDGTNISNLSPSSVARRGLALVPQWRELFPSFSVEETLLAGSNAARGRPAIPAAIVYDLFPRLAERRKQLAGSLSGGEQQMLTIGRALVTNPKVMLLDEPSAGLAVGIVRAFVDAVKRIRERGVAILLVEQNLEIAAALADTCIVLAAGRVAWRGSAQAATSSEEIRRAYFT